MKSQWWSSTGMIDSRLPRRVRIISSSSGCDLISRSEMMRSNFLTNSTSTRIQRGFSFVLFGSK